MAKQCSIRRALVGLTVLCAGTALLAAVARGQFAGVAAAMGCYGSSMLMGAGVGIPLRHWATGAILGVLLAFAAVVWVIKPTC